LKEEVKKNDDEKNNKRWKRELYQGSEIRKAQLTGCTAVPSGFGKVQWEIWAGAGPKRTLRKNQRDFTCSVMSECWGVPEIASPPGWRLRAHYFENALTWPYLRVLHGVKFDRFLLILIFFCFFCVIPSRVPAGYHRKQSLNRTPETKRPLVCFIFQKSLLDLTRCKRSSNYTTNFSGCYYLVFWFSAVSLLIH
jgi:hypothetical protein